MKDLIRFNRKETFVMLWACLMFYLFKNKGVFYSEQMPLVSDALAILPMYFIFKILNKKRPEAFKINNPVIKILGYIFLGIVAITLFIVLLIFSIAEIRKFF